MYPKYPSELKVIVVSSDVMYVVPNPVNNDELSEYRKAVQQAESTLLRYFMGGLRSEIQTRLPADKYTDLTASIEAAKKAEWMYNSITTGMLHNISHTVNTSEHETNFFVKQHMMSQVTT